MEFFEVMLSLLALIVLEVVLGIDNLVILSIMTEKLPLGQRRKARKWGLLFAWVTRLILLGSAVYLVKLVKPLFSIGDLSFSARDIFLLAGGAFLVWKSTDEIHQDVSHLPLVEPISKADAATATFRSVVLQIGLLDIVFSLDSILTAVGLTSNFWIMATAITFAIIIMIYASEPVSEFIAKHPSIKMLALSYLILIGTVLIADGLAFHIPRGYLYFTMGFSLAVESLNLLRNSRRNKVKVPKRARK